MRSLRFNYFWLAFFLPTFTAANDDMDQLLVAAKKGDVKEVTSLLDKGVDVNAKTPYGVTALLNAAGQGHVEVVKLLLKHNADPNAKDTFYGQSPLSAAVGKGNVEMVTALLEAGASDGEAQLRLAVVTDKIEIVRVILDKAKPKQEALDRALTAASNKKEIREILTTAGAKPAAKSESKPAADVDAAVLAKYPGVYREEENLLDLTITLKDKQLCGAFEGGQAFDLIPIDATTFRRESASPSTVSFVESDGKVHHLNWNGTSELKFKRLEEQKEAAITTVDVQQKVVTPLNWPSFRGSNASGVADGQFPPTKWDVEKGLNVRWKTPIPGLGHSCPVVWGDRVFLTSAVSDADKAGLKPGNYGSVDSVDDKSEHAWHVYGIDKRSGKILWDVVAHTGVPSIKRHLKGTHANPTPTTDGKHLIACFGSEGLYCYDLDGHLLWKRSLGKLDSGWFFDGDYQWGFGSSPIIFRDQVIVQCDVGKDSFIAAFRISDGQELWRTAREEIPSWGTPTIVNGSAQLELVTNATKFARGYDPMTGKELWRLGNHAEITVPTPLFAHGLIFITSGYRPIQPIYAIKPGATGDITLKDKETKNDYVVWSQAKHGPYMPTPIIYGDYLYTCGNNGVVSCYEAKTGKSLYRERLGGNGTYTASPVAADGRIYFSSEENGVRVIKAGPKFELLATNPVGDICMATPAISDGLFLLRTQKYLIGLQHRQQVEQSQ